MTYNELRAALSAYMKRTDPETIANEPTALELARAEVALRFFPVESEMVAMPDLPLVGGVATLPADYGRAIAVGDDLAYVSPRQWKRLMVAGQRSLGGKYSVYGGQIHVHPYLTELSLVYNQAPLPITGTGDNWLSVIYPNIWLHAARAEQYRFIEDLESAMTADSYWRGLAMELQGESERTRQAGGPIRMKSR